jgi:leucyl-tRNA synthetase
MFVAPPEKEVEWSDAGLEGSWRFLARVWRFVDQWCDATKGAPLPATFGADGLSRADRQLRRKTHETIRRVTVDVEERIHLNTAVSALMELVNDLYAFGEGLGQGDVPLSSRAVLREAIEALVVMASPFAPHTTEELWEMLGHAEGLTKTPWPAFDEQVAKPEEIVIPVQVNGKLRSRLTVAPETPESELREAALADPAIRAYTDGKAVKSVIVVKGKLINVVVV